jgi:hypothetical protein
MEQAKSEREKYTSNRHSTIIPTRNVVLDSNHTKKLTIQVENSYVANGMDPSEQDLRTN